MKLPAFVRLTIRNVHVNTDPGTLFFMFGIPVFYLFIVGIMYQGLISTVSQGSYSVSYTAFLAPGIVGMQAFTAGNIGGGMLWADRRWGMFEQLLVGPFRRTEYLFGIIFLSVIFAIGGSFIMIILASVIKSATFNLSILSYVYLVGALILGTIFFTSLFLILSIKARSMNAYSTITFLLFFLLDFASTAFYPITSSTPLALRIISAGNPLSYIVNIVRDAMVYGITYYTLEELGLIALLMTIVLSFSVWLYGNIKTGIQ